MYLDRIIKDKNQYAGQPYIKGTPITVEIILRELAAGVREEQIIEGYPFLKREDILACLEYALKLVEDIDGFGSDFDWGEIADWNKEKTK